MIDNKLKLADVSADVSRAVVQNSWQIVLQSVVFK